LKSIASAPGKIILFGEHFVVHGTPAILAEIDKRVTVTSTFTENKTLKINSQLGTFEVPIDHSWEEHPHYEKGFPKIPKEITDLGVFAPFVYVARMFWHLMSKKKKYGGWLKAEVFDKNGLEITIDSDIPVGVGLGSSSACCVATTASITNLFMKSGFVKRYENPPVGVDRADLLDCGFLIPGICNYKKTREIILDTAIGAEQTIFPDTSGADCKVCIDGGLWYYTSKLGVRQRDNSKIITGDVLSGINLVIANSMTTHSTKYSVEKVRRFKENNEKRFSQLCELETKLIQTMHWFPHAELGLKMSENQEYLEEIQVSNETIRNMISSLKEISLGSKITGAGDGGCIIALVEDENLSKVPALLGRGREWFLVKIHNKGLVLEEEE